MRIKVIPGKNSGEVYTVVSLYNKLSSDYNNIHNIRQCRLLGYPGMPGPQGLKGSRGMNGDPGKIEISFFIPVCIMRVRKRSGVVGITRNTLLL